jgi:hypothetical protein
VTPVHLHIVEEADLRGTKLSCVPATTPVGVVRASTNFFSSAPQLVRAVMDAFTAMLCVDDDEVRHVLVISSHGEPMTGTLLEVAGGVQVALDEHANVFEIRPKGLVVLVSACWGGYPSVLRAVRANEITPPPLVVAPVVPIHARHVNELQQAMVDVIVREADMDGAIERVVRERDAMLTDAYGEHVFRIVRRDGTMIPPAGDGGLAAEMQRAAAYRVLAVQRDPNAGQEPPGIAIVQGQDGRYWRVNVSAISDAADEDSVYDLVGRALRFRAKALKYNGALKLGELVDVANVEPLDKHPLPPAPPPFDHATERCVAKSVADARVIAPDSLKRCKRCNWTSTWFQSVVREGRTHHDIRAVCHRDACPEHARW